MSVYYWGRLWDAPFTDDALPLPQGLFEHYVQDGRTCDLCKDGLALDDDVVVMPYILAHLECHLRSALGDVAHLEGRCLCYVGRGNEVVYVEDVYDSYRTGARATLQWLLDHGRGRFAP